MFVWLFILKNTSGNIISRRLCFKELIHWIGCVSVGLFAHAVWWIEITCFLQDVPEKILGQNYKKSIFFQKCLFYRFFCIHSFPEQPLSHLSSMKGKKRTNTHNNRSAPRCNHFSHLCSLPALDPQETFFARILNCVAVGLWKVYLKKWKIEKIELVALILMFEHRLSENYSDQILVQPKCLGNTHPRPHTLPPLCVCLFVCLCARACGEMHIYTPHSSLCQHFNVVAAPKKTKTEPEYKKKHWFDRNIKTINIR